jgi:hypothetical protein
MRYMMFMIPGEADEQNWSPNAEDVAKMSDYNEQLTKAGVLLALDGLQPPSEGARVSFSTGEAVVSDGPFAETKEVIGGYWIIDVPSKQDAVEWASRCPARAQDVIEVRRIFELSDFPQDVQDAARISEQPPGQTQAA